MPIWRLPARTQQPKTPVYIAPTLQIGDGLRLFHRFDEGAGNTRNDSVGTNHAAEIGGAVTRVGPGLVSPFAVSFNQTTFLRITDNPQISFTGNLFGSIWFKLDASNSLDFPGIVAKWAAPDQRSFLLMYHKPLNRYVFQASANGVDALFVTANTFGAPATGVKHFIEFFVDINTHKIGIAVNRGSFDLADYPASNVFDSTADLEIGRLATSTDVIFGVADAFAMWDRRLSEANRDTNWNNGDGIEIISPVAKAGLDQTRMEQTTVLMDGSQSVGDGLTYSWEQLTGTSVVLDNPAIATPSFPAPDVATPETLTFRLTVTETDLDEAQDDVAIRIVPTGSNEWLSQTPQEAGIDPNVFYNTFDSMPSPCMIARFDKVIGSKGDVSLVGPTWSASKGLSALIAARQIQLGNIDYDDLIPDSDVPSSPEATLFQFLNMTSDYDLSPHAPGTHFAYNNSSVHHYISHIKDTFYSGVSSVQMYKDAYLTALSPEDAQSFAGFYSGWDEGLSMSTRDGLRVARLIQQRGIWDEVRILAESFMTGLWQQQIPDTATQSTDESDEFTNQAGTSDVLKDDWSLGHWYLTPEGIQGAVVAREYLAMYGKFGTSICVSRETGLIGASVNVGGDINDDPLTRIQATHFCAIINACSEVPETPTLAQLLNGD